MADLDVPVSRVGLVRRTLRRLAGGPRSPRRRGQTGDHEGRYRDGYHPSGSHASWFGDAVLNPFTKVIFPQKTGHLARRDILRVCLPGPHLRLTPRRARTSGSGRKMNNPPAMLPTKMLPDGR